MERNETARTRRATPTVGRGSLPKTAHSRQALAGSSSAPGADAMAMSASTLILRSIEVGAGTSDHRKLFSAPFSVRRTSFGQSTIPGDVVPPPQTTSAIASVPMHLTVNGGVMDVPAVGDGITAVPGG